MIIVICDVCLLPPPSKMTNFVRDGRTFHVCQPCEDKPFRVPPLMRATVTLAPGAGVEVFVSRDFRGIHLQTSEPVAWTGGGLPTPEDVDHVMGPASPRCPACNLCCPPHTDGPCDCSAPNCGCMRIRQARR